MAGRKVSPEEFEAALAECLTEYGDEVADGMQKAVDIVASEVSDEIKRRVSFKIRTGKYVKSFALKTEATSKYNKKKTWHVKAPHYTRAHLLESGHALPNGRRARAFPHIQYGEELAKLRLPALIEKVVQGERI
jgi:hypothetical protein